MTIILSRGIGPVNSNLWDDWRAAEPTDIRRKASIIDVTDGLPNYQWGQDMQMEETGYWQKKYIPVSAYDTDGTYKISYAILTDGAQDDYQLAHTQDLVLIRFADVLLMHSELSETANGINRVRARVNLARVGYSLAALKNMRNKISSILVALLLLAVACDPVKALWIRLTLLNCLKIV